jgi:hypothetical protein
MTALRDVDKLLWPAVQETLAALGKLSEDSAARKLAQRYAQAIDATPDAKQASVLRWLGPELLKLLESLGATPAARAALTKGKSAPGKDKPRTQLEIMREQRARGPGRA